MRPFKLKAFIAGVKALPITLGNIERALTDSIPIVEGQATATKLFGSHQHIPLLGNVYAISICEVGPGADFESRLIRTALVKALGEPTMEDMKDTSTQMFFMSDDQTIPRTRVHSVLGDRRIAQLCAPLNTEGRAAIDEALAAMEVLLRDIDAKVKAIMAILGKLPPESIVVANGVLMAIVREFGLKNR